MKYLKASTCSILALTFFSSIHSAENSDKELWNALRAKVSKRSLPKKQVAVIEKQEINRDDQITTGISEIEESIFKESSQFKLPKLFVQFHKEVGDRNFSPIYLSSPVGGINSSLYTLIREGQEKKIPSEWIPFGKVDESEYYCINHITGEVCIYLVSPDLEQDQTWISLSTWLEKKWLSH